MTLETFSDAVGAAKVLYRGRDTYLFAKLDWWCRQLGPDKPLLSVTTEDIDEGIRVLIESPINQYKRGAGLVPSARSRSNATVNRYIVALGVLYKLLRQHRRLPRSFVSPVVKGLRLPEGAGRTLSVTLADVHKLVDAARLSRNRRLPALIAVACTTGLRRGSLQALTWGQVDLARRTLDIPTTKNGTPTRSVLPEWAAKELTRIRPRDPEKWELVFGTRQFKRAWASTLERAEIPGSAGWTFHHCRHIAASILAQSGASLPVIMQALNHKTQSMAIRYSHVNTKALAEAVTKAWN